METDLFFEIDAFVVKLEHEGWNFNTILDHIAEYLEVVEDLEHI